MGYDDEEIAREKVIYSEYIIIHVWYQIEYNEVRGNKGLSLCAISFQAYYVSEEGLGGIMFWTIDNDDFRAACSLRPFPLIESAKEALYGKEASFKT